MTRRVSGLTLVELLVATTLMVIVLGIVSIFFARQARLTRVTQAQSEVQDTARAVMQLVSNDLLSAGANQYVPTPSSPVTPVDLKVAAGAILQGTDGGLIDDVTTLAYVSSLRSSLSTACREVAYQVSSGVLERSDVPCGGTASPSVLANNVLAFDLVYLCSDGFTAATPGDCPTATTYVRSVQVGLMLRSQSRSHPGAPQPSFTAPTHDYPSAGGGGTVQCPAGYACAVLTDTVQTPSLKQYAPGG